MTFQGITRKGTCVHVQCEKPRWAKGLCRNHYEALNREQWRRGKPALANPLPPEKEKPLLVREQLGFDPDDLWEFVKKELNITGSRINFESLPSK